MNKASIHLVEFVVKKDKTDLLIFILYSTISNLRDFISVHNNLLIYLLFLIFLFTIECQPWSVEINITGNRKDS